MSSTGTRPHCSSLLFVCLGAALGLAAEHSCAAVRYVNAQVSGGQNNGTSWANAYTRLQDAVQAANGDPSITEIWVAAGMYHPDDGGGQTVGSRYASFRLKSGLALYGGFAGGEMQREQRDPQAHVTILSGDLNDNDQTVGNAENTYRVVSANSTDATAILDGFTIEAGNADETDLLYGQVGAGIYIESASPTIRDCVIRNNYATATGAGALANASAPYFINCVFLDNRTREDGLTGGGAIMSRYGSNVTVVNSLFIGNESDFGGGIEVWHADATVINCTLLGNHAYVSGGGAECSYDPAYIWDSAHLTVINCVFWNNTAAVSGAELAQTWGSVTSVTVSYSDVAGGQAGVDMSGGGALLWDGTNFASDPVFADGMGRLSALSPCLDVGDNSVVFTTTDLDGNARIGDSGGGMVIDLGAYEHFGTCDGTGLPPGVTAMDWDGDGDVDIIDYNAFFGCLSGPSAPFNAACVVFDLDADCDVDLTDFEAFQGAYSAIEQEPPSLCVSPQALNFGASTTTLPFTVWNCGSGQIDYTITDNAGWLSVAPSAGTSTGEQDSVNVTVNRGGLSEGTYQGQITVTANTGLPALLTITMTVGGCCSDDAVLASRTSGAAPLGVFFDALNPASGVVQPGGTDYSTFHYEWDFGDANSGTWATNGLSKNLATGYVAAHVYEDPGTYTVTLRVTDASGAQFTYEEDIVVSDPVTDPTWTSYYVSAASGSDSNTGRSPQQPFKSFLKAMSVAGTRTRILFKRGESWTTTTGTTIAASGPGIIGAYAYSDGSDDPAQPKPLISATVDVSAFRILTAGSDWRLCDLHLSGIHNAARGHGVSAETAMQRNLLLRLEIEGFLYSITHTSATNAHDENYVVDCYFHDPTQRTMWVGSRRFALMGNTLARSSVSIIRSWYIEKGVISHNLTLDPANLSLKFHAIFPCSFAIISDNDFAGADGAASAWPSSIGPQNATSDERIDQIIVERNIFRSRPSTQVGLFIAARNVTVRNNLFLGTGASSWYAAVSITRHGIEPAPLGNKLYNNTLYRGDSAINLSFCDIDGTASSTTVRNNFAAAPVFGAPPIIVGGGSGLVQSHNVGVAQGGFVNAAAENFALISSSPARNAGLALPAAREDFVRNARPQGPAQDVGAFEYVEP